MRKLVVVILAVAAAWGGYVYFSSTPDDAAETIEYEFAEIQRGDLENVISGTGTLSAVGTVEIGTQVSGTIDEVLADYNDHVEAGDVLARLDTLALEASVMDAEANLVRAKAQWEQAVRDHDRNTRLFEEGYLTQAELDVSATSVRTSKASVMSAEAAVTRARANLGYATIVAPIKGTVIQRNVEPGQTVAASLSTPTLFIIAEDLSKMEILGLVDESDIGYIRVGQSVRFTVEAYLDETFTGTVRQIRLQPETISNVVNYTVVVDAANEKRRLYPGMTATIDFIADSVENALLVSNAALRFQPTSEMLEQFRARRMAARGEEEQQRRRGLMPFGPPRGRRGSGDGFPNGSNGPSDAARLWFINDQGEPDVMMVRKGVTDGINTVIEPFVMTSRRNGDTARETGDSDLEEGTEGRSGPGGRRPQAAEGINVIAGFKRVTAKPGENGGFLSKLFGRR